MKKSKKEKELEFEIEFYQKLVEKTPSFIEALSALGDAYTQTGRFKQGLDIDLRLHKLKPEDPIVLYNLACSYSLMEKLDDALNAIKLAIDNGYDDFPYLEEDTDLKNLRQDPRFKEYYSKFQNKYKEG